MNVVTNTAVDEANDFTSFAVLSSLYQPHAPFHDRRCNTRAVPWPPADEDWLWTSVTASLVDWETLTPRFARTTRQADFIFENQGVLALAMAKNTLSWTTRGAQLLRSYVTPWNLVGAAAVSAYGGAPFGWTVTAITDDLEWYVCPFLDEGVTTDLDMTGGVAVADDGWLLTMDVDDDAIAHLPLRSSQRVRVSPPPWISEAMDFDDLRFIFSEGPPGRV